MTAARPIPCAVEFYQREARAARREAERCHEALERERATHTVPGGWRALSPPGRWTSTGWGPGTSRSRSFPIETLLKLRYIKSALIVVSLISGTGVVQKESRVGELAPAQTQVAVKNGIDRIKAA